MLVWFGVSWVSVLNMGYLTAVSVTGHVGGLPVVSVLVKMVDFLGSLCLSNWGYTCVLCAGHIRGLPCNVERLFWVSVLVILEVVDICLLFWDLPGVFLLVKLGVSLGIYAGQVEGLFGITVLFMLGIRLCFLCQIMFGLLEVSLLVR